MELLSAIGGSLISGLFGRSSAKRANRQEVENLLAHGERVRESAERGGFNPLTMLQAVGGAVPQVHRAPSLISESAMSNFLAGVPEWAQQSEKEIAERKAQEEIKKIRRESDVTRVAPLPGEKRGPVYPGDMVPDEHEPLRKPVQDVLPPPMVDPRPPVFNVPGAFSPVFGAPLEDGRHTITDTEIDRPSAPYRLDFEATEAREGDVPAFFHGVGNTAHDYWYRGKYDYLKSKVGVIDAERVAAYHRRNPHMSLEEATQQVLFKTIEGDGYRARRRHPGSFETQRERSHSPVAPRFHTGAPRPSFN